MLSMQTDYSTRTAVLGRRAHSHREALSSAAFVADQVLRSCRQGPDLGGVNLRKCYDFSQIRCLTRTGADALGSVHCQPGNQLVARAAELRVQPVGWRHLDLASSSTVSCTRSNLCSTWTARRGEERLTSLMLNRCALRDSHFACAGLGHDSAAFLRLSNVLPPPRAAAAAWDPRSRRERTCGT